MKQDGSGSQDFQETSASKEGPAYAEDGVDLTLIRWMLSLTPTERLETLQQNVRSIMRLRGEKTDP